jgi:NAD(P)-binding Rossmann-like domain
MTGGSLTTDYLVVGAGAMGMAFTDALIDHADVHVTLVDRRHAAGGHWQDAYPFVQLHQASQFYGVASTPMGSGAVQSSGPEAGLQERARRSEIQSYFDRILYDRFLGSGRVAFLGGSEYRTENDAHRVTSLVSGDTVDVTVRRRVVDATYLSPMIPATSAPPFEVARGARVVAVNELGSLAEAPRRFVIVGSGKTATDAVIWLLARDVPAERITWVRPREPWMLNRAVVQPNPVVALTLVADMMTAAAEAVSLDDMFLRLEAAGVMLRIDTGVTPTMAKTPTLGAWELDLLRTVEHVVRQGHIRSVTATEIVLDGERIALDRDSLVVHCAASGLRNPPVVPLWQPDKIRLQLIRAGFPCFCAALAGFVEATRDDDRERNRLCPPNSYSDTPATWAQMHARGALATRTYGAEPDIDAWANGCALNPARIQPAQRADPDVQAAAARLAAVAGPGLAQLGVFSDDPVARAAGRR